MIGTIVGRANTAMLHGVVYRWTKYNSNRRVTLCMYFKFHTGDCAQLYVLERHPMRARVCVLCLCGFCVCVCFVCVDALHACLIRI